MNNMKTKKISKKLLIVFILMVALFGTLLITKASAFRAPAEIQSVKQTDRTDPTYLTYRDLIDYYDILCCQHGTPLKGANSVLLKGSNSNGSFSYNFGHLTANDLGKKVEEHLIYYQGNDFNKSTYTHFTYGYYSIIEHHIATPKEAYIVAEMREELLANQGESSYELIYENGNPIEYTGGLTYSISETLSTGEKVYTVNQRYVLRTPSGNYYRVNAAKDAEGNVYYVYDTDANGNLVPYTGSLTYTNPRTGEEVPFPAVYVQNVYYVYGGTISSGNTVASSEGNLFLVEYDKVVDIDGRLYYCEVYGDYNYIQIAWWSTAAGTSNFTITPNVPNELAREAEAFEDYILRITGCTSVSELTYEKQDYEFIDENGTRVYGSVEAPVIDYNPSWNEDSDQNGVVNEADQITIAFDYENQKYIIGPFSINYVKESAAIEGRNPVDFACITGATLISNIGELEFGTDWNFKFLADQARDDEENYPYPNPNEVFYIEINYITDLTEIRQFDFDFKYMNAGAELDIFDGYYNKCTWKVKHTDNNDEDGNFQSRNIWLQFTSIEPYDSQTLAHALIGARWYETKHISKEFGIKQWATITIEKKTIGEDGDVVPINETYYFDIYINGEIFETVSLTTRNGYGSVTSNRITWEGQNPTYEVVEVGETSNNGPWTGTLPVCNNIVIEAENYIEPHTGTIEIDKRLINATQELENETFHFQVRVTGTFKYGNLPMTTYTSKNPLVIDVEITGAGEWHSELFKWYGDNAPHYKVIEIIPDGATYELVNGTINGGSGYLQDDTNKVVVVTNQSTTEWTVLEVDKKMLNGDLEPGDVFYAQVTIRGTFSYDGDAMHERELTLDVVLNQANNWQWFSGVITWNRGNVPTFTISETSLAEGTRFVSISDEIHATDVNELTGTLRPERTLIIITNDREEELVGKIKIIKLVETEDLYGKTFRFNVKVTGTFTYEGIDYTDETLEIPVAISVPYGTEGDIPVGEWLSNEFSWTEENGNPTYTVEEVELPEGSRFVSISNGVNTVTSSQMISGELIPNTVDGSVGQVTITCINTGSGTTPREKQAHIVIIKESEDESIDDYIFYFRVTISGTFKYYNIVNEDGTLGYTQYTNETLVLEGTIDDVEAVCGGEDWISELIVWDENDPNPTYTVEEISIPEGSEFVSISNRDKCSITPYISGTLLEGTENNYIIAVNRPSETFIDGSIRIMKKVQTEDLKGKVFYFDLTVTGEFDYAGKHYGPDSENGDTYTLTHIAVEGNGNPWVSGVFNWEGEAPTYTVTETGAADGVDYEFVSISNETTVNTDSHSISGSLVKSKTVKVVAINKSGDTTTIPNGGHIEITKEVLNNSLKGINFYFDVEVTSTSPFRYHDLEDVTNVTYYEAGQVARFEHVVVVADERDWVSGYFEWDEGAAVPTYTVTELTEFFPDGVKTVSIRNDTQIIVEELDNTSGRNLSISGTVIGDVTHIIAVNDIDDTDVEYLNGNIVIQKRAASAAIVGKEFIFTLTLTGNFTYQGNEYTRLVIDDIRVTADGDMWISDSIYWQKGTPAPTYTITENTSNFLPGMQFISIRNAYQTNTSPSITGTVEPGMSMNWIIAENGYVTQSNKGRLQIYKTLVDASGNQVDGVEFKFEVTVGDKTDIVTVTSGGYWRSDWYTWNANEPAPEYHIREIDNDGYDIVIDNPDGVLVAQNSEDGVSGIVEIKAQNTMVEQHSAQIKVVKHLITNDKVSEDDITVGFSALVHITGSFTYNKVAYNNTTLTLRITLSKDNDWTWLSKEISWNGDQAPTFDVEEPEVEIPSSWHLVSVETNPADHELVDGMMAIVDITNEWEYEQDIILTMALGGKVWDDTNREIGKPEDTKENGIIDEGEAGIPNVKVTIYRALADKNTGRIVGRLDGVYAYDENNLMQRIEAVTYTDANGNWTIPAISVPAFISQEEIDAYSANYVVTYDVEFEYDGQTYEPTEFLATAGEGTIQEKTDTFINSSTAERDEFLNDSMAIDDPEERIAFNNSFATITGEEAMDDSGNTLGLAIGTNGERKDLHYTSVDAVSLFNSDNTRKISTLETTDSDGNIYDELKMDAATSNANLSFPFYTDDPRYDTTIWHLIGWDKTITDHLTITYKFEAIYNYCLSVNLGLVEREASDMGIEKDLSEAIVVVNGKALKYRFNSAIDLEDPNNYELLYKQIAVEDAQIEYKLGLYPGDYYYRAAVYDGTDVGDALSGFYTQVLHLPVVSTELEIYLKYTIIVHNQSETYDLQIGSIADYYDDTFTLITEPESKYIQTLNGNEVNEVVVLAQPSTVTYYTAGMVEDGTADVNWTRNQTLEGSDGVTYTKLVTNSLANKKLETGETANISVTFKIAKDNVGASGVLNAIKLGEKHNVAEVASFTSYYSEDSENRWSEPGQISGRVDKDSAPNNINVVSYNEKTYYEDDTDSAPIITVSLTDEDRAISGLVWDDAQTTEIGLGQTVGNGIYNPDEGDKLINGLTTEIYQSISVPTGEVDANGNTVYAEYQFAWPTDEPIPELGNNTLSNLTGFNQATATANGEYSFVGVPAGNYRVRFVYGDKEVLTGKSGHEEVYSGQDYKSTAYQVGFDNDSDNDGYVDNEWHDITNTTLESMRVSDARDDEARRLFITAKSEMLTFDNTSVLATADDKSADHTALFGNYQEAKETNPVTGDGYYMYAETAKINLGVENIYDINYTTEIIDGIEIGAVLGNATQGGRNVGTASFMYNIKNIDCGIEERSQTKLTLDKQIKEITLTTSDNRVILDAIYDISYTLGEDGSIKSTVTLNEAASTGANNIASLNRNGTNQGYRYIMADGSILQGTMMNIKYQITAFNMSETDRISRTLEDVWEEYKVAEDKESVLNRALAKVSSSFYTQSQGRVYKDGSNYVKAQYGTYFGSVYYLGSQGVGVRPDETIVKTKIHNLIDYVDPDIEFSSTDNVGKNQSWTNTEIEYLLANKLIDPSIVQIIDSQGNVTGRTAADSELDENERYSILSDKYQEYATENKNNIITNINNGENLENGSNPGFVKFLEPYMVEKSIDKSTAKISLNVSRFFTSELDTNDVDNISEIIKAENTAGRRDIRAVAGNANPFEMKNGSPIGVYAVAAKEPDSSATEVITLSPPTGLDARESRTAQLILVVLISVTLVAIAIVIIKKKVLIKK